FAAVGGFDERFRSPSVEDIDLGYRMRAASFRIVLDPLIQGKHLKRWTFRSSVISDLRDRGIPWTQLLIRYKGLRDDLNVTFAYRACVVVAYLLVMSLIVALRWPIWSAAVVAEVCALWLLDWRYYRFLAQRRGISFAVAWFPFHVLHHLCNGISFVAGSKVLFLHDRWGERRSRMLRRNGVDSFCTTPSHSYGTPGALL